MPPTQDYIPSKDADFDGWFENLRVYVYERTSGMPPVWSFIPPESVTTLGDLYVSWHDFYVVTLGNHTSADIKAKNDAKKAAKEFIRPFVSQYLKFPPVTDEDRIAMRLHVKDPKPTPIPVPATRVVITDIRALGGFQVRVWFRDEQTPNNHAIPYGFNGCLLNYNYSKEHVTDVLALKESKLLTRSPETITLPPDAQTCYFSCVGRWQNNKGELGPWGDIESVVVS